MREQLVHIAHLTNGRYYEIKRLMSNEDRVEQEVIQTSLEELRKNNVEYITILDEDYPEELKNSYQPPYVLFYRGNIELLKSPHKLYLTGDYTDNITTDHLISQMDVLANNTTLVSRSWLPFERLAVKSYHSRNKGVIFISSSGLMRPSCGFHRGITFDPTRDLIISEYFQSVPDLKSANQASSRICAALSESLIIFSVHLVYGMKFLIDKFLDNNKDVYYFSGPSNHLEHGASAIVDMGVRTIGRIEV